MSPFRRLVGSTRVRLTAVSVLVVGVALTGGGLLLHREVDRNAQLSASGTAQTAAAWIETIATDVDSLPSVLPVTNSGRLTLVQVLDEDRKVIASSAELRFAGPPHRDADERNGSGRVIERNDRDHRGDGSGFGGPRDQRNRDGLAGGPWYVESASAHVGGRTVTVVAYTSLRDYDESLRNLDTALLVGLPILVTFAGLVSWVLVGRALRPVERMRAEVDAITAGSLDRRVQQPRSGDEVGRLANTLNHMLARLQAANDRQRRFIADASHELRTPVANVAVALDVARRYPDSTDWPEVAAQVAAQNQRMVELVDDLLTLGRWGSANDAALVDQPADLPAVLADTIAELPASPIAVTLVATDEPAAVLGDARAIRRVALNLLTNAQRHATSRVDVSVARDPNGHLVWMAVDDDGPGIDPADRSRVFVPFVRLDEHRTRSDGGAGLGLAIVNDLVAGMGGRLGVEESTLGGARFLVGLRPVEVEVVREADPDSDSDPTPPRH